MALPCRAAGKLAVVTGTTSGIGHAVARTLLERGWRVFGLGRRASAIEHDAYEHTRIDLHDIDAFDATLTPRLTTILADRELGRVGLVNNAADPALLGPVPTLDARRLAAVFATNVAAPIWLMGALVRLAPMALPLRIVNVSTGAPRVPFRVSPRTAAAKPHCAWRGWRSPRSSRPPPIPRFASVTSPCFHTSPVPLTRQCRRGHGRSRMTFFPRATSSLASRLNVSSYRQWPPPERSLPFSRASVRRAFRSAALEPELSSSAKVTGG